jgi:hypothetical protein
VQARAVELKYALNDLYTSEQTGPQCWVSRPIAGVDPAAVMRALANLAALEYGFDRIRLRKPPYPVAFEDTGERGIVTDTVDEFVAQACECVRRVEGTLEAQQDRRRDRSNSERHKTGGAD